MIRQLARDAQLPTWWSRRPLTLVWMVLDEPGGRSVVEQSAVSIRGALDYASNQRGLPVLLPAMDLDDSLLVSTGVVWGKFTDVLDQASDRYEAGQYLVGRFSVQEVLGERFYTGEWLVRSKGLIRHDLFGEPTSTPLPKSVSIWRRKVCWISTSCSPMHHDGMN